MYTVYILYSREADRFYIGHTGQILEERLKKHLSAHKGFTAKAGDWEIVHQEILPSREEAYKRELEIKRWKSRTRIKKLIRGSAHPAP